MVWEPAPQCRPLSGGTQRSLCGVGVFFGDIAVVAGEPKLAVYMGQTAGAFTQPLPFKVSEV